ncbi:hypothetical protein NQZ68_013872 [Dissostichus eleginoides]|nr:hypothetical protein NQZ68_013872 [Dissostichus eleginoides]
MLRRISWKEKSSVLMETIVSAEILARMWLSKGRRTAALPAHLPLRCLCLCGATRPNAPLGSARLGRIWLEECWLSAQAHRLRWIAAGSHGNQWGYSPSPWLRDGEEERGKAIN